MRVLVRYHDAKSIIGLSTILSVSDELQSVHNFKVVFLIDHTTLWQDFMQSKKTMRKTHSTDNSPAL